jgi:hypothetical protein
MVPMDVVPTNLFTFQSTCCCCLPTSSSSSSDPSCSSDGTFTKLGAAAVDVADATHEGNRRRRRHVHSEMMDVIRKRWVDGFESKL